jgi:hypothetical protein
MRVHRVRVCVRTRLFFIWLPLRSGLQRVHP